MSAVWKPFLKRGQEKLMSDLEGVTFEDTVAEHGKKLKDLTFENFPDSSPDWSGKSRNSASWSDTNKSSTPTWSAKTKS